MFDRPDNPKDWTEDYHLENRNYFNTCCACKSEFIGHKRRPVCRECSTHYVQLRCHGCKNTVLVSADTDLLRKVFCPSCKEWHMKMFWIELPPV